MMEFCSSFVPIASAEHARSVVTALRSKNHRDDVVEAQPRCRQNCDDHDQEWQRGQSQSGKADTDPTQRARFTLDQFNNIVRQELKAIKLRKENEDQLRGWEQLNTTDEALSLRVQQEQAGKGSAFPLLGYNESGGYHSRQEGRRRKTTTISPTMLATTASGVVIDNYRDKNENAQDALLGAECADTAASAAATPAATRTVPGPTAAFVRETNHNALHGTGFVETIKVATDDLGDLDSPRGDPQEGEGMVLGVHGNNPTKAGAAGAGAGGEPHAPGSPEGASSTSRSAAATDSKENHCGGCCGDTEFLDARSLLAGRTPGPDTSTPPPNPGATGTSRINGEEKEGESIKPDTAWNVIKDRNKVRAEDGGAVAVLPLQFAAEKGKELVGDVGRSGLSRGGGSSGGGGGGSGSGGGTNLSDASWSSSDDERATSAARGEFGGGSGCCGPTFHGVDDWAGTAPYGSDDDDDDASSALAIVAGGDGGGGDGVSTTAAAKSKPTWTTLTGSGSGREQVAALRSTSHKGTPLGGTQTISASERVNRTTTRRRNVGHSVRALRRAGSLDLGGTSVTSVTRNLDFDSSRTTAATSNSSSRTRTRTRTRTRNNVHARENSGNSKSCDDGGGIPAFCRGGAGISRKGQAAIGYLGGAGDGDGDEGGGGGMGEKRTRCQSQTPPAVVCPTTDNNTSWRRGGGDSDGGDSGGGDGRGGNSSRRKDESEQHGGGADHDHDDVVVGEGGGACDGGEDDEEAWVVREFQARVEAARREQAES